MLKMDLKFTEANIKPTLNFGMLEKINYDTAFDLKYIILNLIGLDKASIYSPDWPSFFSLLNEEHIKSHERVLDILFKILPTFDRFDEIVDLLDFKFMDEYNENLEKYLAV